MQRCFYRFWAMPWRSMILDLGTRLRGICMSDYTVISAVSNTLLEVLKQNITMSPDAGLSGVDISLLSPPEMHEKNGNSGISVWLYKVSRMSEMLNDPPERRGSSQILRTPLPIILF